MTYDPIVVDSTAELDRLLESGHAPPPSVPSMRSRSVRLTSPLSSASSTASDSEGGDQLSRPKLTDHLHHLSFSPKRPRSVQSLNPVVSPLARSVRQVAVGENNKSMNMPTPRPVKRQNIHASSTPAKPEVKLHPATPSTAGSKFTRMAKGISKDIEATQQHIASNKHVALSLTRPASASVERNPFHDEPETLPARAHLPTPHKSSLKGSTRGRVQLPDVTGLTNAVESPLRPGAEYYLYKAENKMRDSEGVFKSIPFLYQVNFVYFQFDCSKHSALFKGNSMS